MTLAEIKFAFAQRERVVMPRGSVTIMRPMVIRALTTVRRTEFEEERGKGGYYHEVQLIDSTGRGWISASPEQLDPAEPEKFASMMARYRELERRRAEAHAEG